MSILKYSTSNKTSTGNEDNAIFPTPESFGVSSKEYESIVETIKPAGKVKTITYKEEDKMKSRKYANLYGIANAVRQYSKEFPNISESTLVGWLRKFRGELTRKVPSEELVTPKNVDDHLTCQRN